jgi:DtxR family transcriptional regulator, Mn-dependent transcriptional regulator
MLLLNNTTESEQMYLVSIALLGEAHGEFPIHISQLAETLQITPISTNQGIHHLEQMGLVSYIPYRGVALTDEGWQIANKILRSRRLWEVFLVEHLHYDPETAEALACDLEHSIPSESADRLAAFLGWPQDSPQGKPIPRFSSQTDLEAGMYLDDLPVGATAWVTSVQAGETERAFLREAGLRLGTQVAVLGVQSEAAFLLRINGEHALCLSAELAQKISVTLRQ